MTSEATWFFCSDCDESFHELYESKIFPYLCLQCAEVRYYDLAAVEAEEQARLDAGRAEASEARTQAWSLTPEADGAGPLRPSDFVAAPKWWA